MNNSIIIVASLGRTKKYQHSTGGGRIGPEWSPVQLLYFGLTYFHRRMIERHHSIGGPHPICGCEQYKGTSGHRFNYCVLDIHTFTEENLVPKLGLFNFGYLTLVNAVGEFICLATNNGLEKEMCVEKRRTLRKDRL